MHKHSQCHWRKQLTRVKTGDFDANYIFFNNRARLKKIWCCAALLLTIHYMALVYLVMLSEHIQYNFLIAVTRWNAATAEWKSSQCSYHSFLLETSCLEPLSGYMFCTCREMPWCSSEQFYEHVAQHATYHPHQQCTSLRILVILITLYECWHSHW